MASGTSQYSTSALYAELNKAINLADYRNALKAANKCEFFIFIIFNQGYGTYIIFIHKFIKNSKL